MRRLVALAILAAANGSLVGACAAGDGFETLLADKRLECRFGPESATISGGAGPDRGASNAAISVHFDAIDLEHGKARMSGKQGAGEVTTLLTVSGITFIEGTGTGSLIFTTVFADTAGSDEFFAVQSRHMTVMTGVPQPSQHYGTCKLRQ